MKLSLEVVFSPPGMVCTVPGAPAAGTLLRAVSPLTSSFVPAHTQLTCAVPGPSYTGGDPRMLGVRQGLCRLRSPGSTTLQALQERLLCPPQYWMRRDHGVCKLRRLPETALQEEKADDD